MGFSFNRSILRGMTVLVKENREILTEKEIRLSWGKLGSK
jgi:hypothetical protein